MPATSGFVATATSGSAATATSGPGLDASERETSRGVSRRRRGLGAAALGLAAALSLSACQWTSTMQTDQAYEPADGTSAQVGQVLFSDLIVISTSQGDRGNIVGRVTNNSTAPARVSVSLQQQQPSAERTQLTVPAGGTAQLTQSRGRATTIESVPQPPGSMVMLHVQAPAGQTLVNAPVLLPEQQYASLAPSAPAPTPGEPATATPGGTSTATSSPTGTGGPAPQTSDSATTALR